MSDKPSIFHVTIPIITSVVMRIEAYPESDVDDMAQAAYRAWKRGDEPVCHLAPQAEWDNASVDLVEDNSSAGPEWEPDDERDKAQWIAEDHTTEVES